MSWRPRRPGRLIAGLVAFTVFALALGSVVVASVLNVKSASAHTYHAVFTDASGLQKNANVKIAGIDVGVVKAVELAGDRVKVTFTVAKGRKVFADTHAEIRFANLIGTRYVALTRPSSEQTDAAPAPSALLPIGSTIPLDRTAPAIDLTAVFNGFQPLFDALTPGEVNQLSGSIINVFQGQSGHVENLVEQIGTVTTHLADRKKVIESVVENLSGVLTKVNSEGEAVGTLIENFDTVVTDLAGQKDVLAQAITSMGRFTGGAAELTEESSEAITKDILGLSKASRTLVANSDAINKMLRNAPDALRAIDRTLDSGSYLKVYLCNLQIQTTGSLNLSLVEGVPAPQSPTDVQLPSGVVGSGSKSGVCR